MKTETHSTDILRDTAANISDAVRSALAGLGRRSAAALTRMQTARMDSVLRSLPADELARMGIPRGRIAEHSERLVSRDGSAR